MCHSIMTSSPATPTTPHSASAQVETPLAAAAVITPLLAPAPALRTTPLAYTSIGNNSGNNRPTMTSILSNNNNTNNNNSNNNNINIHNNNNNKQQIHNKPAEARSSHFIGGTSGASSDSDVLIMNEALEVGAEELAHYLTARKCPINCAKESPKEDASENFLVVDCRSFIQYNNCHIQSAINAFYSKIMRRRLADDTVCSDLILNHLSLSRATENLDLILYASDESNYDTSHKQFEMAPLKCKNSAENVTQRKSGANDADSGGGRTLYERRKGIAADNQSAAKKSTSNTPAAAVKHENERAEPKKFGGQKFKCLSLKIPKVTSSSALRKLSAAGTLPAALDADTRNAAASAAADASFIRLLFEKLRSSTRLKFRRVMLLKGGFEGFRSRYPELCESSHQQQYRQQRGDNSNASAVRQNLITSSGQQAGNKTQSKNSGSAGGQQELILTAPPGIDASPVSWQQWNSNAEREYSIADIDEEKQRMQLDLDGSEDYWTNKPSTSLPPEVNGPTKIFDYLYLGTMDDAEDENFLKTNKITRVINICERAFRPSCVKNDASHFKQIFAKDSNETKLFPLFDDVVRFIENARQCGEKVLIHCQAGISRSATLAVAYVIRSQRVSFRDAYEFVKRRRNAIEPNFSFVYQLMRYADELKLKRDGADATDVSSSSDEKNGSSTTICNNRSETSNAANSSIREHSLSKTSDGLCAEAKHHIASDSSHKAEKVQLLAPSTNYLQDSTVTYQSRSPNTADSSPNPAVSSPNPAASSPNRSPPNEKETRKRSMTSKDKCKSSQQCYATKYAKKGFGRVEVHKAHSEETSPTVEFSKLDISLFPTLSEVENDEGKNETYDALMKSGSNTIAKKASNNTVTSQESTATVPVVSIPKWNNVQISDAHESPDSGFCDADKLSTKTDETSKTPNAPINYDDEHENDTSPVVAASEHCGGSGSEDAELDILFAKEESAPWSEYSSSVSSSMGSAS